MHVSIEEVSLLCLSFVVLQGGGNEEWFLVVMSGYCDSPAEDENEQCL